MGKTVRKITAILLCILLAAGPASAEELIPSEGTGETRQEQLREEPDVTQPPETKPKATEPPETQPPETKPKVTEPPETQPPETKPKATDPPETQPPEQEPPAFEDREETASTESRPPEAAEDESEQPHQTEPTEPTEAKQEESIPDEEVIRETVPEETQPEETQPEETQPEEPQQTETEPERIPELTAEAGVSVTVTSDDGFPAGSSLAVRPLSELAGEYIYADVLGLDTAEPDLQGIALDIKIMLDGRLWQPDGQVQVTVSGISGLQAGSPVQVYHLSGLDADMVESAAQSYAARFGGKAKLRAASGSCQTAQLPGSCGRGSVTFTTEGFSTFYILSGNTDRGTVSDNVVLVNGGTDNTIYAAPGTTITFQRNETHISSVRAWRFAGGKASSITATAGGSPVTTNWVGSTKCTLTVSADAAEGDSAVLYSSWGTGRYNEGQVTVIVRRTSELIDEILASRSYPVYLTVIENSTAIPGEPSIAVDGNWRFFPAGYGTPSLNATTPFAASGEDWIPEDIADNISFLSSYDGTNTMGVADATGGRTLAALAGSRQAIDYDAVLRSMWNFESSSRGTILGDGTRLYAYKQTHTLEDFLTEYWAYPYVIKIQTAYSLGWHIDCCIVRRSQVRLSYDLNIPSGSSFADSRVRTPSGVSVYPGSNVTVDPGRGSSLREGESYIVVDRDGREYSFTFLGWYTSPSRTGESYQSGDSMVLSEDTILYAGWEPPVELTYHAEAVVGTGIAGTEGTADYPYDALVLFRAETQPGWRFDGWYDGEQKVSDETEYAFRMPRQDVSLEARAVADFARYRIEHWFQNPDGQTFTHDTGLDSYAEGMIGQMTDAQPLTVIPDGFSHLRTENVTIRPEGSAARVYYARQLYTIHWVITKDDDPTYRDTISRQVRFGDRVMPPEVTIPEYYTFDDWQGSPTPIPETMPSEELTIDGLLIRKTAAVTASKSGMRGSETALVLVTGPEIPGLLLAVPSGGSVTVSGLKVGESYTFTEQSGWSWAYLGGGSQSITVSEAGGSIDFSNIPGGSPALYGEDRCVNLFGN